MKKKNLCVIGATGLVGKTFLSILDSSNIDIGKIHFVASKNSVNKEIVFRDKKYLIEELNEDVFTNMDYALFFVNKDVVKTWAPIASKKVKYVIDNSSLYRNDKNHSLVIPEINFDDINSLSNIISNPNCSTIQCLIPLSILAKKYTISRIIYTTYQSVSGSGQKGIEEYYNCLSGKDNEFYPYDISKTCIPKIDEMTSNGFTLEELKMVNETKRILKNDMLNVTATCVRVPILNGHAVSVITEFKEEFDLNDIKKILQEHGELIKIVDYPTTIHSCNNDFVYVGRLRKDLSHPNTLMFYVTGDNLRRGASYNSFKILKMLIAS